MTQDMIATPHSDHRSEKNKIMTRNLVNLTWGQAPCEMARDCNATLRPQVRECIDSLSVRRLRTASLTPSDCQSDAFGLRSFRYVVTLLLMMVVGVRGAWGQTDYSGTYYIASDAVVSNKHIYNADDHTNNYYLCPTEGWISFGGGKEGDNTKDTWTTGDNKPFLTTYKVNLHVNDQAPLTPYDITKAKWIVEYYTTENEKDYYYIKHSSGKYLVLNKQINGVSGNNSQLRIRLHLESLTQDDLENETTRNNALYAITPDGSSYVIDPKTQATFYLTVNKGNGDYLQGENRNSGGHINNTYYLAGTIGIYQGDTDDNKYLYLEEIVPRPTFTNTSSQININHSEENTTIYYTTDGTNPTTTHYNGHGPAPLQINMPENSVTIKAIAAGTDNLPSCISKIRVVPAANITLGSSPIVYNGSAQEPTVTVKDGETIIPSDEYTVSYSSNNINAGETVTVTITDNDGGNYIVYGSTTFTINPKPVAITANDVSKTYNGSALTEAGFTSGELEAGDTHSFAVTMTEGSTITNVGTQPNVIATVDGVAVTTGTETAVGNYLVTTANGTLTINPKAVAITANDASKTYNGSALTEAGFTSGELEAGDTHSFAVTMTEGSTITNVGTQPNVIATVDGVAVATGTETAVGNYLVTTANGTLEVTKKALTITADSDTKEYDGIALTKNSYTNTELATDDVITSVTVTGSQTDRGSSANVPSAAVIKNDNGNGDDVTACYNITYVNGTLSVTGRAIIITADSGEKVYDGTALTKDSYTYDDTKLYSGDAIESVTITGSQTAAGTSNNVPSAAVIKNGETNVTANYDVTYVNGTLTVTQKAITVKADNKSKEYLAEDPTLTATATGLIGEDVVAFNTPIRTEGEDVGSYTITVTGEASQGNYTVTYDTGTFTITKKALGLDDTNKTPASGINIEIAKNEDTTNPYTVTVTYDKKSGEDKTLVKGEDYEIPEGNEYDEGNNHIVIIKGKEDSNYSGEAKVTYINLSFDDTTPDDPSQVEGAAVYCATQDLQAEENIEAWYVTAANAATLEVTIKKIETDGEKKNYIPAGSPVLLLGTTSSTGFMLKPYTGTETVTITDNILQVSDGDVPVTTPDYYIWYQGEFVLSMWGSDKKIKAGKFYIYTGTGGGSSPAPAFTRLHIVKSETTKVDDVRSKMEEIRDAQWYTLDGQKLNKKPTRKGLYIQNGKKVVIK